jgi:hypothetical protein
MGVTGRDRRSQKKRQSGDSKEKTEGVTKKSQNKEPQRRDRRSHKDDKGSRKEDTEGVTKKRQKGPPLGEAEGATKKRQKEPLAKTEGFTKK